MKTHLLHRDHDLDWEGELAGNGQALTQDLELDVLLGAMAAGDGWLTEVAKRVLLSSLGEPDAIAYRQQMLADCERSAPVVRELYAIASEAIQSEKRVWGGLARDSPRNLLGTSVEKMQLLVASLRRLRALADEHAAEFCSEAFTRFFGMVADELGDDYLALVDSHLKEMRFRGGMLISAQLDAGNKGASYVLRRPREQGWLERMLDRSGYSFTIAERDDNGLRALRELEDRGVNDLAGALAEAVAHVLSFFATLRAEVGFCVGCLNLRERLVDRLQPVCFPDALPRGELELCARELHDPCLGLASDQPTVGNDIDAGGKSLVMITGANQGGKSTMLRSLGLAQLMMQAGMFVAAESLRANVVDGVFTHFKREEDAATQSGKLDEELARMSEISSHIRANCLLLCNESFAATNEREGSEIARQVLKALLDEGVKVLFVTHLFDLADGFYAEHMPAALFLRAERGIDGARPFKLHQGRPLPTSYGEDSFRKVFGRSLNSTAKGS
jgi:hypothetical protein